MTSDQFSVWLRNRGQAPKSAPAEEEEESQPPVDLGQGARGEPYKPRVDPSALFRKALLDRAYGD